MKHRVNVLHVCILHTHTYCFISTGSDQQITALWSINNENSESFSGLVQQNINISLKSSQPQPCNMNKTTVNSTTSCLSFSVCFTTHRSHRLLIGRHTSRLRDQSVTSEWRTEWEQVWVAKFVLTKTRHPHTRRTHPDLNSIGQVSSWIPSLEVSSSELGQQVLSVLLLSLINLNFISNKLCIAL